MEQSKYIFNISLNGEEHPTKVYNKDVFWFFKQMNKELIKQKRINQLRFKRGLTPQPFLIPNELFYDIIWKSLIKTGFLFWKKPFRSKKQMVKLILKDEMPGIVNFVTKHVLNQEDTEEDSQESKKK